MYRRLIKPLLDFGGAALALILLAPLILATAVAVRVRLGRPVLFRQTRSGRHGRPFQVLKFRTMTDARDSQGRLLPDEQRLLPLGRLLRATSLDELPQLLNVLRGEMSLVGPRPLLERYWNRYTQQQRRRCEVRPGVTGWAQVHGRNAIDWQRKLELDVWYVDRCSLWLDLRILARTVGKVVGRADVSRDGHATSPEFQGNGVAVLGAGGHGKVVVRALQEAGQYVRGVYDDDPQLWGGELCGVPIRGGLEQAVADQPARAVLAVGDNDLRRRLAEQLDLPWTAAVHPRAAVDAHAVVHPGAVICAGAVVQAGAEIGAHAIVNTGASVDHDCRLEAFVHVGPGARLAGDVTVGRGAFLGAGSIVTPGVVLGRHCLLGAGSVALRDVPPGETVVGAPARPLRRAA